MPTIVARVVLPPIIADFLHAYPGITLEVIADDSFIDIVAAGFDAGVRYDERLEQDMIAVPIGPRVQRFAVGAAPDYLAARGCPMHPRDLLDHDCILHRFASGATISTWEFERAGEVVKVGVGGRVVATTWEMELAAAVAGLGIYASFEEFLASAFADGRLVPVLEDWWQNFPGPFLYYAGRRHMPAPLRSFIDFIKERS